MIDAVHFDAHDGVRGDQHAFGSTTCARTSTARTTAARPGQQITARYCPTARTINVVREDPKRKGLLFAGTRDARSTCRSTMAITGSRCA